MDRGDNSTNVGREVSFREFVEKYFEYNEIEIPFYMLDIFERLTNGGKVFVNFPRLKGKEILQELYIEWIKQKEERSGKHIRHV